MADTWVLTTLTPLEQRTLENDICDEVDVSPQKARIVIEHIIAPLLVKAEAAGARGVLAAAIGDLDRMDGIQKTALDDVAPADLTWSRAPEQTPIRELVSLPWDKQRPAVAAWLRARSLRGGTP